MQEKFKKFVPYIFPLLAFAFVVFMFIRWYSNRVAEQGNGLLSSDLEITSLTQEEEDLNKIALFTSKNQNKTGKGFGMLKGVSSFIGSTLGTTGAIGGLAGMSKGAGFGVGVAGAVFSGLGILGGIGQMIAEKADKPKDADLDANADKLIELLRKGSPAGLQAAEFVKTVLKINLVDPSDPSTWLSWIDEDIDSAKALIKSKLSKL